MKVLSSIVILIVKILIRIGDITLFLFEKIIKFIRKTSEWVPSGSSALLSSVKDSLRVFGNRFSLFIRTLRFYPKTKTKKISIFPVPLSVKMKFFLVGFLFSSIFIFIPLLSFIFIQDLPNPKILALSDNALTTKIYDRNGNLLYQIYATENRTQIPLSDTPKYLREATIAIEDNDFYSNPGFNIEAIARSLLSNLSGKPLQGGSTITQQLIKSKLLNPEKSITRKIKEIILAFWAEKIYKKEEIFEMYLNQIPYGGTAWGVEAASQTYFGKRAKDLNLSESAFLAGLPNAPTVYSPYGNNPNLWKKRREEVLKKMVEQKFISKKQADEANKIEFNFQRTLDPIRAPHFVMYIKDLLIKKYGLPIVEKGGLMVRTSLDLKIQGMAEKITKEEIEKSLYLALTNGASLVTAPLTGDVLAMVGSKDYSDLEGGNYNVTLALRQPGSSIKAVTYSAALQKGFTAATIVEDAPITFTQNGGPSYSPVNYDGRFHGPLTIRQALSNSVNIPAVKILNAIGIPAMLELGKKMGITTWKDPKDYGLSITLGGAEVRMIDMATVYGVLANQGYRVDLNPILEVTDSKGHALEKKGNEKIKVLDEGVTFMISDILSDNKAREMEFGTNSPLVIKGRTVSVKTGTSDNKRDNWTIGYTPSYLVAVWVGNNDNSPMNQSLASGITGAAPIWHRIMENLLSSKKDEKYSIPSDIVQKQCLSRNEYFIKGTENFVNCAFKRPSPSPQKTP